VVEQLPATAGRDLMVTVRRDLAAASPGTLREAVADALRTIAGAETAAR